MAIEETPFCLIYVTASGREEAEKLAQAILEKRLAACANIYAPVRSLYWWEGQIQTGEEAVLILKAPRAAYRAIEREILAHHSYQTPAILQLPVVQGLETFLGWIAAETQAM